MKKHKRPEDHKVFYLCDYEADQEWETERQDKVFDLMNEGLSARRIAKNLGLPVRLVESDMADIRKVQHENR